MSASDSYALWCFQGSDDKGISDQFDENGVRRKTVSNFEPRIKHDELDIVKASLDRGFMIPHEPIRKMYDEIQRLREIESHLCVVAIDGKFSHYIDDREPEHRKKFEDVMQRGFEKYDKAFKDKRMSDDWPPEITAG